MIQLADIYRRIPASKCPDGCGKCCGIVFPSSVEIRNIRQWCEIHNIEFRNFPMDVDADCPYLQDDKRCRIYPARPFLCRIFGVSEVERLHCPECKPTKVLTTVQTDHLYKLVYGSRKERKRENKYIKELTEALYLKLTSI